MGTGNGASVERRQLQYFLDVVEHGSLSKAARSAGVSQSALSQSIAALEADLEVPLFVRVHRGLSLTSAGQALVEPARETLEQFRNARRLARSGAPAEPHLTVACPPYAVIDPLSPALGAVRRRHPHVHVSVLQPGERRPADLVLSGAAEVAVDDEPAGGDLVTRPARDLVMLAVLQQAAGPGEGESIAVADLLAAGLVLSPPGDLARELLADVVGAARVERAMVVQTEHPESLLPLVSSGGGATLLPTAQATWGIEPLNLVACRTTPELRRPLYVVRRRGSELSVAAGTLLRALCPTGRDLD